MTTFGQLTEGAEEILYELAAVYSSAAPAAEDAEEDLSYFEQKLQLTLQRQVARMLNGGMSGLSGCGGSVGLNTNIMVIMEVAGMLRSALPQ